VEDGSIKKEGASDIVTETSPIDINSEPMLPNSKYIKAAAISCNECGSIKPEDTENCYGPAALYNVELDLEKRQSSSEQCENPFDQESKCLKTILINNIL
jgi:hypothetical protein